ncbi:MAG: hypothetical protein LBF68_07575, partial [Christensenellaceae bacterium]|nr:hypothetical protein [Christensenellaceae bacterium]
HKIPILCFFDLKSLNKTKSHFDIINNSLEKSVSYDDCNKALDFLQGIDNDTWENIRDNISGAKKIDEKLLGEYSIILNESKDDIIYMLEDTPVYDWYPNEEIKKRIQEKADYIFTNKKNKIIDKIDKMDAQKAKDCLKQMVDNNTLVALEFLKGMDSNDL